MEFLQKWGGARRQTKVSAAKHGEFGPYTPTASCGSVWASTSSTFSPRKNVISLRTGLSVRSRREGAGEVGSGPALCRPGHVARRTRGDRPTTLVAGTRADVDHPVTRLGEVNGPVGGGGEEVGFGRGHLGHG